VRCRFAYDDAGYVLGALAPDERQEFVAHLPTCVDCRTSVRDLAGLPGLLARVEPQDVLSLDAPPESAPATLLPRLLAAAQADQLRVRRRRTMSFALAACFVLVLLIAIPLGYQGLKGPNAPPAPPPTIAATLPMSPLNGGDPPVRAAVGLAETKWGTEVVLRCNYRTSEYAKPQTYGLYAVPRSGAAAEPLGSWEVSPGQEVRMSAATKLRRADLAALEIRRADGTTILRTNL
jgi:hypothetical protein